MVGTIYWPEAGKAGSINFVGYNHAIAILVKAVGNMISTASSLGAKCRLYCNIPWHHAPAELKKDGLPLVAYTMFESTRLPTEWRNFLNHHCAAAIVPTRNVRDNFRLSGVRIPLKVAALGVDPDEHRFVPPRPHVGYNYLWMGHNYDPHGRKGSGFVERAFRELKREGRIGEDTGLFLKYRPHKQFPIELDNIPGGDGVIHYARTMKVDELRNLLELTDCCVNPSHGEGFGMIPLEQMAAGRPVLLTRWSYPFADEYYNVPLEYDLLESPVHWCFKHFSWGKWGFDYTWKGLIVEKMVPNRISPPANGELEYGVNLLLPTKSKKTMRGTLLRLVERIQTKTGFYWKPNHKRHTILFESPGLDAWVNMDDLKNKMEFAYHNRDHCAQMGRRASDYVKKNWGLDRVRDEFRRAIEQLYTEGVI